jgi:hypothetical protein
MDAYAQELRGRVLRALERENRPTAIANQFEVSRALVYQGRTVSRRRDSVAVDRLGATGSHGWSGWSRRYEPCRASMPHRHWSTITFVAGLRYGGITAPMVENGTMT